MLCRCCNSTSCFDRPGWGSPYGDAPSPDHRDLRANDVIGFERLEYDLTPDAIELERLNRVIEALGRGAKPDELSAASGPRYWTAGLN